MGSPSVPFGALAGLAATIAIWPGTADAQSIVSDTSSRPYPGVEIREGRARLSDGCFADWYAAVASLCTDYLHVDARAPASSTRTTGSWGDARGVQVAVNGDFYRYDSSDGWFVYGDAVGNGDRWPRARTGNAYASGWWYHDYGWIAFGPGWVEYSHTRYVKQNREAFDAHGGFRPDAFTEDIPEGTVSLVSGFPEIVTEGTPYRCPDPNGECFPDRSDMRDRHPRTAMGVSEDRRTFYLVVVDGRQGCSASAGMYGTELAWLVHELGAWQAFNLDGGGSSALWVRGSGYLNEPSDGSARAVLNHWGIFAGEASGASREPLSCVREPDAGTPPIPDAGVADAAVADGGTPRDAAPPGTDAAPTGRDAETAADAATEPTMSGGCACDAPGSAQGPRAWPALALFLLLFRRLSGAGKPSRARSATRAPSRGQRR